MPALGRHVVRIGEAGGCRRAAQLPVAVDHVMVDAAFGINGRRPSQVDLVAAGDGCPHVRRRRRSRGVDRDVCRSRRAARVARFPIDGIVAVVGRVDADQGTARCRRPRWAKAPRCRN